MNLPQAHVLTCKFSSLPEPAGCPPGAHVLGMVNYSTACHDPVLRNGHPELSLHLTKSVADGFAEVWTTPGTVVAGERDGIVYAHDGDNLFCAGRVGPSERYAARTKSIYTAIFDLIGSLGYRSIFRMWNFVNHINENNDEGLEIYRDFCKGRAEAFEQRHFAFDELPAATGIGSLGGGIALYVLASRATSRKNIENMRQVPAYRYPERYGPRSPSFARATYLPTGTPSSGSNRSGQLYVAGTASILGHETVHIGDIEKQTMVTLDNISHLIGASNLSAYGVERGYQLTDLRTIKVYVRHAEDIPAVREMCAEVFSPAAEVAFLNVDICRSDLLVEIEGVVA
jgi:chorismate lyase/3-hydroxybenzoate synthase